MTAITSELITLTGYPGTLITLGVTPGFNTSENWHLTAANFPGSQLQVRSCSEQI